MSGDIDLESLTSGLANIAHQKPRSAAAMTPGV
jgi:hypothetical protein